MKNIKKNIFKNVLTCFLFTLSCLSVSFLSVKAGTKSEAEKMIGLSKAVVLYDDCDSKENMLLKVVLLNTKPKVKRKNLPEKINYNEYRYSDFIKTSKRLFGKVIDLNVPNKRNDKTPVIYYNKKTKTIYEPLCYYNCIWDDIRLVKHREIESLGENKFVVNNYAIRYRLAKPDKIPTENIKVYLSTDRSSKYGYIVTDIQVEDLNASVFKLGKKDVEKQIKNIKKWYYKPGDIDKKEEYEERNVHYSYLLHNNNPVFLVKNDGDTTIKYYYKDGVLIKYIETKNEGNKLMKEYDIYYKNHAVYMNDKKLVSEDEMVFFNNLIIDADYALELVFERIN